MEKYQSKNRRKWYMKVHLVFVCKYRRKVLDTNISSILKNVLMEISSKYQFDIDIMETDKDHIHLLVSYDPKFSVDQIVRILKGESTNRMWLYCGMYLKNSIGERNVCYGQMDILLVA